MQSGFHLESMGNKFIGFFFFLKGGREHDDIYEVMSGYITGESGSRGNRQEFGDTGVGKDEIHSTRQQCISWYSAVSLLLASPVLSHLSPSSMPVRCRINSQVRAF